MAHTSFSGRVRISGLPEPRALLNKPPQTSGPLVEEFFDVVGTHLVDHQEDDEFRARRSSGRPWGYRASRRNLRGLWACSLPESEKKQRRRSEEWSAVNW